MPLARGEKSLYADSAADLGWLWHYEDSVLRLALSAYARVHEMGNDYAHSSEQPRSYREVAIDLLRGRNTVSGINGPGAPTAPRPRRSTYSRTRAAIHRS